MHPSDGNHRALSVHRKRRCHATDRKQCVAQGILQYTGRDVSTSGSSGYHGGSVNHRTKIWLLAVLMLVWVGMLVFRFTSHEEPQLAPLTFKSGQKVAKESVTK